MLNALAFGFVIFGAESWAREGPAVGAPCLVVGGDRSVLLVRRELRRPAPLVPFDLLRIPIFGLSIATSVASFGAQMLAYAALPFYFQTAMGGPRWAPGLLMTPWPLAVGLAAPVAGGWPIGTPRACSAGIGLGVFAAGLALLSLIGPARPIRHRPGGWRCAASASGSSSRRTTARWCSSAPMERSGAAGGMLATARLLGQTAGAVTTAVFFHVGGVGATTPALGTASVVASLAALVSLLRLGVAPPDTEVVTVRSHRD